MEILSESESRDFGSFLDSFVVDSSAQVANSTLDSNAANRTKPSSMMQLPPAHLIVHACNEVLQVPSQSVTVKSAYQNGYARYSALPLEAPGSPPTSPRLREHPSALAYAASSTHSASLALDSYPAYAVSPSASSFSQSSFFPPQPPSPSSTMPAAAPLLPYQMHQSAAQVEAETQERMRMQTKELGEWMRARGMNSGAAISDGRVSSGSAPHVYRDWTEDSRAPKRVRGTPARQEDEIVGERANTDEHTMRLMREAEVKAGLDRARSNYSATMNRSGADSPDGARSGPSRYGLPSNEASGSTLDDRSYPTRAIPSASSATFLSSRPISQGHNLNPSPHSTPLNIPPSSRKPLIPASRSTSHSNAVPAKRKARTSRISSSPDPSAAKSSSKLKAKPALLSTAQKKANHIASEQKRRAAIRAGYELLCESVPALQLAVEEEEGRTKSGKATSPSKTRGKAKRVERFDAEGQKIDGRAGPKSEAVVLGKSVDYLRNLLQIRQDLLVQLSSSYSQAQSRSIVLEATSRAWEDKWDMSSLGEPGMRGDRDDDDDQEIEEDELDD